MSKTYPVEFLETMLLKIDKYLLEYERVRQRNLLNLPPYITKHPCGEIWSFSIKVNDFGVDAKEEIKIVREEIKDALKKLT